MTEPSLRTLNLSSHYRSDREDVVNEFYVPALKTAVSYDRAVGYFTATSLALVSRGIERLTEQGGVMRLLASPQLDEDDVEEIRRGYDVRKVLERSALRAIEETEEGRLLDGLGQLGRLVARGQLDIKLAFVTSRRGEYGIYHEKIGVIRDRKGDAVAFTGSANETFGGMVANFETVEVYRSWEPGDDSRVLRLIRDFDELWRDETPRLKVLPFPDVARERLMLLGRTRPNRLQESDDALVVEDREEPASRQSLMLPDGLVFRDYQKAAVRAWFRADGRGMFKMATGTGKTKTALAVATQLARQLREREIRLITLVVAPYQHLVDQWVDDVAAFGVRAEAAYESSATWLPRAQELINGVNLGAVDGAVIITTNATLMLAPMQDLLRTLQQPLLIIADEAHNLGSARGLASLPVGAAYRLALSATPERWFDESGTVQLEEYFGPVVFELGMERAIELGALCHYLYRPRIAYLDQEETQMCMELSDAIGTLLATGASDQEDDGPLGALLRKRAGVLGHAASKLPQFKQDLAARSGEWFQLAYCAEGSPPESENVPHRPRQIDEVVRIAGAELELPTNRYVSETPRIKRRQLLQRFGTGNDLKVLVSMRCLDEGVDVPDARVAYLLASSSNPRQFIQRRGRLLRPAPGKERAEILDYIAVPPPGSSSGRLRTERALVGRELTRAHEFAKLADNFGEALEVLRPLKEEYGLLDL